MYKVWQNKKKQKTFNVFQQMPLARHCFWSIMSPVMSTFHAKGGDSIPATYSSLRHGLMDPVLPQIKNVKAESVLGPSAVLKEGGVVV